jgi:hypothetical protein
MSPANDDWLASNAAPPSQGGPGEEVPEPRLCAECSSPLGEGQLYCLECGAPSEAAPGLISRSSTAPLVAGTLVGLGLLAGVIAIAFFQDDDDPVTAGATTVIETSVPTESTLTAPTTVETEGALPPDPNVPPVTEPLPTVTTTEDPGQTTTQGTTPVPTVPEPESDWPPGRTAWTAIVSSVRDRIEAEATKEDVRAAGQPAGILWSSDHPGLAPGYWVVFSGVFDQRQQAVDQAADIAFDFPGSYPRLIASP